MIAITKKAAFLGRFQPLHKGHYRSIQNQREDYDLIIAVGSPEKSRTQENPLTFGERKNLLDSCFPDLEKVPIEDEDRGREGYPQWGRRLIRETGAEIVITRNETVIEIIENFTDADLVKHELHEPGRFSGTRIRQRVRNGEDWKKLVPDCSRGKTSEYEDIMEETG